MLVMKSASQYKTKTSEGKIYVIDKHLATCTASSLGCILFFCLLFPSFFWQLNVFIRI